MSADSPAADEANSAPVFSRVLVGVDGSAEAHEAVRQAAVLAGGEDRLTLVAVYDVAPGIVGGTGTGTPPYLDEDRQRASAEDALEDARQALRAPAGPVGKVVRGNVWDELVREIASGEHTLVALGSHGTGRARGMLVGSVATELIHKAPCSLLVARKAGDDFPRRIVVGVDGSPESTAAYATAQRLSERFGAELRPVVGHGGKGVDEQKITAIVGDEREDVTEKPVEALVSSAADADLLIVGSRGLHGFKSLGSVSERVAHRAPCTVLIVR